MAYDCKDVLINLYKESHHKDKFITEMVKNPVEIPDKKVLKVKDAKSNSKNLEEAETDDKGDALQENAHKPEIPAHL